MIELVTNEFWRAEKLFRELADMHLFATAVLNHNELGRIYVDNKENPQSGFMSTKELQSLVGNPNNEPFNQRRECLTRSNPSLNSVYMGLDFKSKPMNTHEILALYDEQERKNGEHPSYQRQETAEVVRYISKDPSRLSFITYSQLTAKNADAIIQRELAYFQEAGGYGFEWKTYAHDLPPDLAQRLVKHGFAEDDEEALLVIDLQNCPQVYLQPVTLDVRRIKQKHLQDVVTVLEGVYDRSYAWLEKQMTHNLTEQPDYWSIYVAYVDGNPACAAWSYFPNNSQFAGLWGGATLAEYRKMGLYTAVVAKRAQEAMQRGYRFLMVDASDMSRPILLKRGFQLLTHTTPYTWKNLDYTTK